jgi:hypothetical protein
MQGGGSFLFDGTFTIMATQYEIELEAFHDGSTKMVASEHESTFPHLATDRHFLRSAQLHQKVWTSDMFGMHGVK